MLFFFLHKDSFLLLPQVRPRGDDEESEETEESDWSEDSRASEPAPADAHTASFLQAA
jgi:hypothetical protein